MSIRRKKKPIIGICGGHDATPEYLEVAEEVGKLVAEEGWYLICGGLTGVMDAACKGASSSGGFTIGVLPGGDVTTANDHVKLPIATGVGYARNSIIILTADAIIAIDGAEGTLSEMCYSIVHEKPTIVVSLEDEPVDMGGIRVDKQNSSGLTVVKNAEDAIKEVKKALSL
ncbi:MAG: TIGR00725 family protein [Candidatus Hodarchaeota archaeon]